MLARATIFEVLASLFPSCPTRFSLESNRSIIMSNHNIPGVNVLGTSSTLLHCCRVTDGKSGGVMLNLRGFETRRNPVVGECSSSRESMIVLCYIYSSRL